MVNPQPFLPYWLVEGDTPVKSGIPASANQQGYLEVCYSIQYAKPINCANGW